MGCPSRATRALSNAESDSAERSATIIGRQLDFLPADFRHTTAAVHHGGVARTLDPGTMRGAAASMGPPFITAEWQNAELVGAGFALTASMGPPFITAEWPTTRLRRTAPALRCFNGAAVHHGGVGRTSSTSSATPRIGFNGAAVHHGGVGEQTPRGSLQRDSASMGPPFITAEWGGVAICRGAPLRDAAGFNGAAVHHGGVGGRDSLFLDLLVFELQWGRRSSRRSGGRP